MRTKPWAFKKTEWFWLKTLKGCFGARGGGEGKVGGDRQEMHAMGSNNRGNGQWVAGFGNPAIYSPGVNIHRLEYGISGGNPSLQTADIVAGTIRRYLAVMEMGNVPEALVPRIKVRFDMLSDLVIFIEKKTQRHLRP